MNTTEPTQAERDEYARLVALKAWGPRYFELHAKIRDWDNSMARQLDVFGERVVES